MHRSMKQRERDVQTAWWFVLSWHGQDSEAVGRKQWVDRNSALEIWPPLVLAGLGVSFQVIHFLASGPATSTAC